MNTLNLSENLVRLRHEKGVTQEEVAEFVGVTKASVSKWETRQSIPDVMILPLLASYYDVTIDALIGYEPQLCREQIQKLYKELAEDFVKLPFEEVMTKCDALVKKYFSCYPLLFQIAVLWVNHANLAEGQERQMEVLDKSAGLCSYIISKCKEISLCNDAVLFRAMIALQCGRPLDTIDAVEDMMSPCHIIKQGDSILIQAYQMAGQNEKAVGYAQISMYLHLLSLVTDATLYLGMHVDEPGICQETIDRIDRIMEIYQLEYLHENTAAVYQFQVAAVKALQEDTQEALKRLKKYVKIIKRMIKGSLKLHGDTYFSGIEQWVDKTELGNQPVRDKRLVQESSVQAFSHPAFAKLQDHKIFLRLKEELREGEAEDEIE